MIQTIKLLIGSSILIFIVLLSWNNFYSFGCISIIFPFIIWGVISYSFIEKKMNERLCFKECYFDNSSILSKLLLSPYLVTIVYGIISSLLTISIIYGVINYPTILWWYLIVHILSVIVIYLILIKVFKSIIRDRYIEIFAREWTINISSLLLLSVYIYILLTGYVPSYLSSSLLETIQNASNSITSHCVYIDYILRLNIELDSSFWWITSSSSQIIDTKLSKSIIWLGFIVLNSLSILGINRFIVMIVYLVNKIITNKSKVEKD
ncbi:MAG: hypothetical protein QM493_05975 [Sulfurovum sp.]